MNSSIRLQGLDLAALKQLAVRCASRLPHRCVMALSGTLGAGKTTFTQAFAEACGIDPLSVTSPTFTLVQQYLGDRPIYHIDAYRMADEDEFVQLGGEELLEQEATVLIEWPERIAGCLPNDRINLSIEIEPLADQVRTVEISASSSKLMTILQSLTGVD